MKSIVFRLVCCIAAGCNAMEASPLLRSGLVEGDFAWGVCGHPLGGMGAYTEDRGIGLEEQMGLLREIGAEWYRIDVFVREDAPNGFPFAYDELDRIYPVAERYGIKLYVALACPYELRPYETLLERMSLEEIRDACFTHARAAARKWRGKIMVWDLLNEPDGVCIMPERHGDKIEDYHPERTAIIAAILMGQADGIRQGDPEAKISFNIGGWLHWGLIDIMNEKGLDYDILSWHWYDDMGIIDNVAKAGGINVMEKLISYGKPIWVGEFNARTEPEKGHIGGHYPPKNAYVLDSLRRLYGYRSQGLEAVFIYELLDIAPVGTDERELQYGLVEIKQSGQGAEAKFSLGARKPIFHGVQSWLTALQVSEMK